MRSYLSAVLCLVLLALSWSAVQAQDEPNLPSLSGTIAYVGTAFNVYTIQGSDGARAALTRDAGRTSNVVVVYQWPTWSTDGRLAYFGVRLTSAGQISTDVY